MKDLFGKALLDFQNGNYTEDILTSTSISEDDVLHLPYLFRTFSEMPKLEKKALKLAKGKTLDVGCGSGSHSLYLQNKGINVKAIDISEGAIEVAKQRGVLNASVLNVLDETELFDAEYQRRKVPLNKPMRGDVKKFKVYVKDPKSGNVKKVNFGHGGTSAKRPTMRIRKSNPKARKSFRARHNCANPGPKTKARYWSCRKW